MIGLGMVDCRSSILQVSSLHSPLLPSLGSKKGIARLPGNRATTRASVSRTIPPKLCGTSGVWGSGQSGLAAFRKQKRVQCGGKKIGRGRVLVQCEADANQGLENVAAESTSDNGSSKSPSIASEVSDAVQSPGKSSNSPWLSEAYALLIRIRSTFNFPLNL
jgi:hypothetical protein